MFPDVHAAGKHDLHLFRACGRETLRGFFDTLCRAQPLVERGFLCRFNQRLRKFSGIQPQITCYSAIPAVSWSHKSKGGHTMDITNFGQTIAGYRKERAMTQEQLAQELGVTAQAVSKWENGDSLR